MALTHDVRYAARALRRSAGFTSVAIVTLGLGIGATTAIFSVVNAVLLRPLPYPDADRIVQVFQIIERPNVGTPLRGGLTPDQFQIWRDEADAVSQIAVHGVRTYTLTGVDEPVRLNGAAVTPSLFPLLGIAPLLGRTFEPDAAQPGAEPVVILSQATWERYLGSDPDVLDRLLTLEGNPHRVVGVMPRGFDFPALPAAYRDATGGLGDLPQFWVPVGLRPPNPNPTTDIAMMPTVARLRPELSLAQAEAEANTLVPPVRPDRPFRVEIVTLEDELVAPVRPALLMLQTAVGFLLLIACANVTNLLLARGAGRQRELAIRLALGAGRAQITRDILAESLLLALGGGTLGCLLAWWGTGLLRALPPGTIPRIGETSVDGWVLAFALTLSLATGLLVGLVTAVRIGRVDPLQSLRDTAGGDPRRTGSRPSSALAIAQVAAATVLLVGASLLANSFVRLLRVDPGFDPDGMVSFQIALPRYRYADTAQRQPLYTRLYEAMAALPGAEAVVLGNSLPTLPPMRGGALLIDGERAEPAVVAYRLVTPGFFRGLGVPLRRGRELRDRDRTGQPPVAVVNDAFARHYFPTREALGAEFVFLRSPEPIRIVGVVGDMTPAGPDGTITPEIYFSYLQFPSPNPRFSPLTTLAGGVRTTADTGTMASLIRDAVRSIDPELAVHNVATLADRRADALAQARFYLIAAAGLAVVALLLAAIGIYGVLAYAVTQRTRELGIRIALGADAASLVRTVSMRGLGLALAGLAVGVAGALWTTRFLDSMLFGVTSRDPLTLCAVVVIFCVTALAASYVPARRATRVDPLTSLRAE
ncbi:MAG: ABC transporter permease [Acidobacteria bacterium]|nr:ABC transporter permease [Acidobacteriota bacterium]